MPKYVLFLVAECAAEAETAAVADLEAKPVVFETAAVSLRSEPSQERSTTASEHICAPESSVKRRRTVACSCSDSSDRSSSLSSASPSPSPYCASSSPSSFSSSKCSSFPLSTFSCHCKFSVSQVPETEIIDCPAPHEDNDPAPHEDNDCANMRLGLSSHTPADSSGSARKAQVVLLVALDRGGAFESNLKQLHLLEGHDYYHFS